MGVDFHSPSFRASSSDLTIAISPLGLVELADEEFEVHGPRLNRYAHNFAFYLGHHWAYKREMGEPQITFNYVKAFSDFITNFTFGRGVNFRAPKYTQAIVPPLLKRVWEIDNKKDRVLWEMGSVGSVTGDCFVKIAYEEPWVDAVGRTHSGRVRILPLNPSHCFPEWHPHDRDRLIRFKLKYRFWGTAPEGTRRVFTYTEIITESEIIEYVNDELLPESPRPNPLGMIPVVHIPNVMVSGSPWGLADIGDITNLNREFNEKATDISDIINYHAAPVTVVKGAKVSQLEKGPKKVWGGIPANGDVYNLELHGNLANSMSYLELVKRGMHELTGVPETALGQMQPISNTSGVALAIQYQPTMQRYSLKKINYGVGLEKINEIVLLTLAVKEPMVLQYDPTSDATLNDENEPVLDPSDPGIYRTTVHWPPPLPVDVLIKMNEIQAKMGLGLESKRGALRELGYEFPEEKMDEVFKELVSDAKDQGALDLLRLQIQSNLMMMTGMPMGDDGTGAPAVTSTGKARDGGTTASPAPAQQPVGLGGPVNLPGSLGGYEAQKEAQLMAELVTKAYGTKAPQRRNPANEPTG